jgi:hypothetical protein
MARILLLLALHAHCILGGRQPTSAVFTGLIETATNGAVGIALPTVLPKKEDLPLPADAPGTGSHP